MYSVPNSARIRSVRGEYMNLERRSGTCIFLLVFLAAGWAIAQSGQGEITGLVTDPTGSGIPSAAVTLTNEESGVTQSLTTNPEGRYLFAAVPVGRYSVKVEVTGFQTGHRHRNRSGDRPARHSR